jgi:hypothetical protein
VAVKSVATITAEEENWKRTGEFDAEARARWEDNDDKEDDEIAESDSTMRQKQVVLNAV